MNIFHALYLLHLKKNKIIIIQESSFLLVVKWSSLLAYSRVKQIPGDLLILSALMSEPTAFPTSLYWGGFVPQCSAGVRGAQQKHHRQNELQLKVEGSRETHTFLSLFSMSPISQTPTLEKTWATEKG